MGQERAPASPSVGRSALQPAEKALASRRVRHSERSRRHVRTRWKPRARRRGISEEEHRRPSVNPSRRYVSGP